MIGAQQSEQNPGNAGTAKEMPNIIRDVASYDSWNAAIHTTRNTEVLEHRDKFTGDPLAAPLLSYPIPTPTTSAA